MRFDRIEIDAFGALCDTRLEGLGGRLSVIFGANGAGKTTLLHFLRGVFCGYERARRLGLLPAVNGEPGGGAVDVHWQGELLRLRRTAAENSAQQLRVTVVRDNREAARFDPSKLPMDQMPLLFAVEHADVHALDRLVQMARQAGIDVETKQQETTRLTAAAADAQTRQTQLHDSRDARINELTSRRSRLQCALEQSRAQLDKRSQQLTEEYRTHIESESRRLWQRVNWLQAELQSVESDLREAEESAWSRRRPSRIANSSQVVPEARLRRVPATKHLKVDHRQRLADVESAIEQARLQLAQIARARLEVNLQAARIAGSLDLPTDEFLKKLRGSLSRTEDSLLELQADAERINHSRQQKECRCAAWAATSRTAVEAIRHRLYRTCDCVSQFELQHRKAKLRGESARLDREEQAQFDKLNSLQRQWQELTEGTDQLASWRGPAQRRVEHELCECAEHHHNEGSEPSVRSQSAAATLAPDVRRTTVASGRPNEANLSRLRQRRSELAAALDTARQQLRASRAARSPWEPPEDVRNLEQRIDQQQLKLDAIERELSDLRSRARDRSVTDEVLRRTSERVDRTIQPPCMRWAAKYLSRLTGGRYVDLRVTGDEPAVWVIDDQGRERSPRTLSRGTLNQVALSLRLALVRALAEKDVRFPLVLDDVLVDCDIERLQETVQLLREFAAEHDQQILYLTCGAHLVSLFEAAAATIRSLPGTGPEASEPRRLSESPAQWSVHGWIDRQPREGDRTFEKKIHGDRIPRHRTAAGRPTIGIQRPGKPQAAESDRHSAAQPLRRRQAGDPYWLSEDSRLLLVPSIGEQMGRRLSALGIRTVAELLTLAEDESSNPLKSLQVEPDKLREWQAEALLLICVPHLTGPDAQLLVACDVRDPDQLAASDVDQLIGRLDRSARRQRHSLLSAAWPSRESIGRWIQCGRRSRSLASIGLQGRPGLTTGGDGLVSRTTSSEAAQLHRRGRSTDQRPEAPLAIPSLPLVSEIEASSESDDGAVSRLSIAGRRPSEREIIELKFYLHAESPVEEAPSIGPKTASQLGKLKIITVGDLLAAAPATIAERLNHRRVKEQTVAAWQQQARLMCRIPQLRGHDAQVLVACDITEPEQVARLDAQTLFSIVGPFVSTKEGQRLLRSSKAPDLQEVADWITWANQARPLRAA